MVKYYGEGDTKVGEYRSVELGASFSTEEYIDKWGKVPVIASPAKDIDGYLCRAGSFVGEKRFWNKDGHDESLVYHYAGATVFVRHLLHKNAAEKDDFAEISVKLTSNEPLDCVIGKLVKKFPYLQQK